MRKLILDDVEIAFEIAGSGVPIVLVPGFASGAWSWNWQVDDLAKTNTVITFDPRGISRSKLQSGANVSIEGITDDIYALITELGYDRVNILGISFGGFVAQQFALKYGEKVEKLILASTSFGGPNHVMPSDDVLAMFASTEDEDPAARIRHHLVLSFSKDFVDQHRETVDEFCDLRLANAVSAEAYGEQLRAAYGFNVEGEVSKITAPVLVITGDEDVVVPPRNSGNLFGALPNAKLYLIKGSGHMAFVEKASEFNRAVMDFLADTALQT